ncbi:MAG TPA: hypothetical protein VGJ74_08575 [Burkholderiales bacterium]|jgi:hypothetical protein
METVMLILEVLRRLMQRTGPYVALEILLPGGTLLVLGLLAYRHRKNLLRLLSIPRAAVRL